MDVGEGLTDHFLRVALDNATCVMQPLRRIVGASPVSETRFPNAPPQIASLPTDRRGFPVPWFVTFIDGEPEFRAVDPSKIFQAHGKHTCWVCGRRLGPRKAFVIGPMCAVNRVSAEPPSCLSCARFSVTACPFMSRPLAKRADLSDLEGTSQPPGLMIARNPGVTLIWETATYRAEKQPEGGLLFRIGSPMRVSWWREGREASRAEVIESVRTGLPALRRVAEQDGPDAVTFLNTLIERAVRLFPAGEDRPSEGSSQHEHATS